VEQKGTVSTERLAEFIEGRTALNYGEIFNVLMELHVAIRTYCLDGNAVKIEGLGTFSPSVTLPGRFKVNCRMDAGIGKAMNVKAAFTGTVINRENVGLSSDNLIELWNEDHPEDPVV
jgi:hypothetical protein